MLRFAPRPAKVYQGPPRSDEILYVSHVLFNVYNVLDVLSGFLWMERARWGGKEQICARGTIKRNGQSKRQYRHYCIIRFYGDNMNHEYEEDFVFACLPA